MQVGDVIERRVRWSRDEIVAFATATGDFNPVHHDDAYAQQTRFGGLIAAGGQPIAALLGLAGSTARPDRPGVGLEFTFKLLAAAKPDEDLVLRWEIAEMTPSERPRGTLVILRGGVFTVDGRPIVTAEGRTLMVERL